MYTIVYIPSPVCGCPNSFILNSLLTTSVVCPPLLSPLPSTGLLKQVEVKVEVEVWSGLSKQVEVKVEVEVLNTHWPVVSPTPLRTVSKMLSNEPCRELLGKLLRVASYGLRVARGGRGKSQAPNPKSQTRICVICVICG
jgi:hypothetical protein